MRVIYIFLLTLLLTSCYTKQQALRKFCKQDTVTTTVMLTVHDTFNLPADSALFTISDSLYKNGLDTLTVVYEDTLQSVSAVKNKGNGSVAFKVKRKPHQYINVKVVPFAVKVPCNCPDNKPTWKQKVYENIKTGFAFLGLVFFLLLAIELTLYIFNR